MARLFIEPRLHAMQLTFLFFFSSPYRFTLAPRKFTQKQTKLYNNNSDLGVQLGRCFFYQRIMLDASDVCELPAILVINLSSSFRIEIQVEKDEIGRDLLLISSNRNFYAKC